MEELNIVTSAGVLAAGLALAILRRGRGPRQIASFVGATGGAWTLHFLTEALLGESIISDAGPLYVLLRLGFAVILSFATIVFALVCLEWPRPFSSGEVRKGWIATCVAGLVFVGLVVGRGAPDLSDVAGAANVAARTARDLSLAASLFGLTLFALRWRSAQTTPEDRRLLERASLAILLYPGIVAGVYLHPQSERLVIGLFAALAAVAALWLHNTSVADRSRLPLLLCLVALALPLLALATVRIQGGVDAAADGAIRALARAAGPLWFGWVVLRSALGK